MRLFVSVPVPFRQREHLLAALTGGRTTNPEQWHLTLAFLGDRDDELDVLDALTRIEHAPFSLQIAGSGTFPGVEWAGVDGDLTALRELAADVAVACRVPQTVYRPHVTYARRGRAALPRDYLGPAWTVASIDLVHSVLGAGADHRVLASVPLTPR